MFFYLLFVFVTAGTFNAAPGHSANIPAASMARTEHDGQRLRPTANACRRDHPFVRDHPGIAHPVAPPARVTNCRALGQHSQASRTRVTPPLPKNVAHPHCELISHLRQRSEAGVSPVLRFAQTKGGPPALKAPSESGLISDINRGVDRTDQLGVNALVRRLRGCHQVQAIR